MCVRSSNHQDSSRAFIVSELLNNRKRSRRDIIIESNEEIYILFTDWNSRLTKHSLLGFSTPYYMLFNLC